MRRDSVTRNWFPPHFVTDRIICAALEEDVSQGDITTLATVQDGAQGEVALVAREAMVWCGLPVVHRVLARLSPQVSVHSHVEEGQRVKAQQTVARMKGPARALLTAERTCLNFVQRLSGVATLTRHYVDQLPPGASMRICDTRKTIPGLRALDRYAVRCGGGHNHRDNLSSAIMIKDNHVAAAGGIVQAIERAKVAASHATALCCEVDDLDQLERVCALDPQPLHVIMLDNFDDASVARACEIIARGRSPHPIIEVTGGITPERIAPFARLGVQVASVGAITHGARAVDLGFDWL